ncbi:MAG: hypothetical protein WA959_15675 [Rivularia sp. (in: cyanobacteria)]
MLMLAFNGLYRMENQLLLEAQHSRESDHGDTPRGAFRGFEFEDIEKLPPSGIMYRLCQ